MAARGAPLHMSGRCAALSTDQFSLDRLRTNPIATLTSKARQCYRSMPNARKTFSVEKYANAVTRQDSNKLSQNPRPTRINNGKAIKSVNDGNTSQKISLESPEIFCKSPLSKYSHTKANREVSGKDAKPAPHNELRLASSETATTTVAEIKNLNTYCSIESIQT